MVVLQGILRDGINNLSLCAFFTRLHDRVLNSRKTRSLPEVLVGWRVWLAVSASVVLDERRLSSNWQRSAVLQSGCNPTSSVSASGSAYMLPQQRLWAVLGAAFYISMSYTFAHASFSLLASPLLSVRSSWVWEPRHQDSSATRSPQQQLQGAQHNR
jgi:hypothetical protein